MQESAVKTSSTLATTSSRAESWARLQAKFSKKINFLKLLETTPALVDKVLAVVSKLNHQLCSKMHLVAPNQCKIKIQDQEHRESAVEFLAIHSEADFRVWEQTKTAKLKEYPPKPLFLNRTTHPAQQLTKI